MLKQAVRAMREYRHRRRMHDPTTQAAAALQQALA